MAIRLIPRWAVAEKDAWFTVSVMLGGWWLISGFFGYEIIMAYSPLPLPLLSAGPDVGLVFSNELNFFWWYFLSSIAFNGVLSKILGTSMT